MLVELELGAMDQTDMAHKVVMVPTDMVLDLEENKEGQDMGPGATVAWEMQMLRMKIGTPSLEERKGVSNETHGAPIHSHSLLHMLQTMDKHDNNQELTAAVRTLATKHTATAN